MLRHYLVSAWRSATTSWLHTAINILGLSIGLAAAILIALYLRNELTYDDFLVGQEQVYRLSTEESVPGRPVVRYALAPVRAAAALSLDFPEVAVTARLDGDQMGIRRGEVEASEPIFWADPSFFTVLGLKTIAGDAATALEAPDSVVLTRRMARKYFGTDTPLGGTLEFGRKTPMRVTAVIEDLPSNTHLTTEIIASGRAPASPLVEEDASTQQPGSVGMVGYLYFRLKPGVAAASLVPRLVDFAVRRFPVGTDDLTRSDFIFRLDPVTSLHFLPYAYDLKAAVNPTTLAAVGLVGVLIIAVAGVNFVNLMTARAARRAVEVGMRKALGATRRQLIAQFMGEAVGFAGLAAVIAIALVELVLPRFNALVDRDVGFAYWRDPTLALGIIGLVLVVGGGAGVYPALVLSSFRPAVVLKSARAAADGGRLRQVLVVLQFAVSIGLGIATLVIAQQTDYATGQSLRFNKDQVVVVNGSAACAESFRNEVATLPGVRGAVCSRSVPLSKYKSSGTSTLPDGRTIDVDWIEVDFGFFDFYGLPLLAGRSFDRERAEDSVPTDPSATMEASIMINEAAMRAYGFVSPAAALGQVVTVAARATNHPSPIIGVVPDFPIGTIRQAVQPSVFFVDTSRWRLLSVKLDGACIPETLATIDRLWSKAVVDTPIDRQFLDSAIESLYRDVERQEQIFAGFSAVAIVIGCLGLFGLSAFAAERRTKEIGIRKALGATTIDVVRLLIWQFVKPVLIANLLAWPIAWWFMRRWLDGFAYRIELDATPFLAAGAAALIIAVLTTTFHAVQVARSRPVSALRYE
jgi:putative ABC transport system permease protein